MVYGRSAGTWLAMTMGTMDSKPEVIQLSPGPGIAIRARVPMADLPSFFAAAFGELAGCARDAIAGPPFAIYHSFPPHEIDVSAVFPLHHAVKPTGRVIAIELAGGPAVQVKHIGPYEDLGQTYIMLEQWLQEHHRARSGAVRELYMSEPNVPPAELVTYVIQPLQPAQAR